MVLTTKGIDDMCLKYFVEAGAIACRRVPKDDLRCAREPAAHLPAARCRRRPRLDAAPRHTNYEPQPLGRHPHPPRRRVAKATGATVVTTLADMDGNEAFDPEALGAADEVAEESVAGDDVIMIKGTRKSRAVTGAPPAARRGASAP